jgi:hypothetical protein
VRVKTCDFCGNQIKKNRKRFCGNKCKDRWHNNMNPRGFFAGVRHSVENDNWVSRSDDLEACGYHNK